MKHEHTHDLAPSRNETIYCLDADCPYEIEMEEVINIVARAPELEAENKALRAQLEAESDYQALQRDEIKALREALRKIQKNAEIDGDTSDERVSLEFDRIAKIAQAALERGKG